MEKHQDNIKRGEQIFNQMLEQTSYNIFRMFQEAEGDVSEVYQIPRYRLNQLFEKYRKRFKKKAMFNLQIIQTREFYYHFMKISKT